MTVAHHPGHGCNDEDTNNGRRRAWRSSELEGTFSLPGEMICPLHGGGYMDRRRGPPPPPQLAAVARQRCRSQNTGVSQSHERHQATRDDPPNTYFPSSETFTNDCYYLTDERPFSLGYRWAEPGKGWTRSHLPTSYRSPPDAPKDVKKSAMLGNTTLSDGFTAPSARDTAWAMSYLSREDGLPRQQKVTKNAAREQAGRRECQHAPTMVPPRGFTASRRSNAAHLAETNIMKHKLDSARIYNKGLRVSNSELARQVVALRRKVEAIARPTGADPIRQPAYAGATDGNAQGRESVTGSSHGLLMKADTVNRDEQRGVSPRNFPHNGPSQPKGCCRREQEGGGVEQKLKSPREERKSKRAPPKAQQTRTLVHIRAGPERKSRNRPEAHAQTQTEAACLVSVGDADPATGWQSSFHQGEGSAVCNEEALKAAATSANSRPEGRGVVGESGAVAGARVSSGRGDQTDCQRPDTESLKRREEGFGEEFYSCEGSEQEGRPKSGAETIVDEQTQPRYLGCSRVGVGQRPRVAASTAEVSQEMTDWGRNVDKTEIVLSKNQESHRERGPRHNGEDSDIGGSVEAGLAPVPARGISGAVKVDPPERRGDELEGLSQTSIRNTSLAVVCLTSPPPSLGRRGGHALRPPASSDALRASPMGKEIVEAEQMSQDAPQNHGDADEGKREDKKWTETTTHTRKMDYPPKKEVEDLEQKLHSTKRALAAFKIELIIARYNPPDRHEDPAHRFAAIPAGPPRVALALSRWRSLGDPGRSRGLCTRTDGSPSNPTAAAAEAFCEGSIEDPKLTATAAPAPMGFSLERSIDGDDRENDIDFLADKAIDGTLQRERDEDSRLTEKRRLHPLFPPMPPIPPAPRPVPRTAETDTPPSVPAVACDELEQDRSACEGAPLSLLQNHCSTVSSGTMARGPPLGPNHRSKEGEQPRKGIGRTAGDIQSQDDLAMAVSRGRLGDISVLSPFSPPLKEEKEQEQEQQEQQEQQQDGQEEKVPTETKDKGKYEVGDHGRETSIVRKIADVVPSGETAMHAGGERVPLFEEGTDERTPARSDKQEPEPEEEREEGAMGHREELRRAACTTEREKEADANSLVPADDDGTARNNQQELGDVEDDGGARGGGHGGQGHDEDASCTTADEVEAADGFYRRDTVPQRGREAEGIRGRDEDPSTVAERQEEESDSSYRRDCAVLAGTAKIVFALLALEHRGVSSRFYRWKRIRHRQQRDRSSIVRATGKNRLPDDRGVY